MNEKQNDFFTKENFADKIDDNNNEYFSEEQKNALNETYNEVKDIYDDWKKNNIGDFTQDEPFFNNPITGIKKIPISQALENLEKLLGIHEEKDSVIKITKQNTGELETVITNEIPITEEIGEEYIFGEDRKLHPNNSENIITDSGKEGDEILTPQPGDVLVENSSETIEINEGKGYMEIEEIVNFNDFINSGEKVAVVFSQADCPGCENLKLELNRDKKSTDEIAVIVDEKIKTQVSKMLKESGKAALFYAPRTIIFQNGKIVDDLEANTRSNNIYEKLS